MLSLSPKAYTYKRLADEDDNDQEDYSHKRKSDVDNNHHDRVFKSVGARRLSLSVMLLSSLLLNVLFSFKILSSLRDSQWDKPSRYAGLAWNLRIENTLLEGLPSEAEEDDLWSTGTSYDRGVVAISHAEAQSLGLPRAQDFPWDTSKGTYLISAYHNLHCIRLIRDSLVSYRHSTVQQYPWEHVVHCLHVLREDIYCNADDTPRYIGPIQPNGTPQPDHKTGIGQMKVCRDWAALERWADEHNACWKHIDGANLTMKEIERYMYCPSGSPYADISTKFGNIVDER